MKKHILSLLILVFTAVFVSAQKKDLLVKSSDKGLYLEHKVGPKESFYSLGRLYNVSPKYLAAYNKIELAKGLQIAQQLRVPLTDTNFTQQGNSGTPIYYKVGDKEGLMSVSNKINKVKLANLRSWNNLASDELKKDARVIVGFLLTNEMTAVTITPSKEEVIKEEPVEEKIKTKPVEEKKETVVVEDIKPAKVEQPKAEPVKQTKSSSSNGLGYFKNSFEQQVKKIPLSKDATVTSGIFKTTSGWQDAKFYLLIDGVQPGTIIKVINPSNNKAIYAKVLGEMSGIRQNEGLNIRISNAAAAVLEIQEQDKFIVKVNY